MTNKRPANSFHWSDPLLLDSQLSEDERQVRDAASAYCQDRLAPRVLEAFRRESTDPAIFREMGELGLLGAVIPEAYGGSGLNYVCYGLVAREVERVDSGYRSMMSEGNAEVQIVMAFLHALSQSAVGECFGRAFKRVILKGWKQVVPGQVLDQVIKAALRDITAGAWNWLSADHPAEVLP